MCLSNMSCFCTVGRRLHSARVTQIWHSTWNVDSLSEARSASHGRRAVRMRRAAENRSALVTSSPAKPARLKGINASLSGNVLSVPFWVFKFVLFISLCIKTFQGHVGNYVIGNFMSFPIKFSKC